MSSSYAYPGSNCKDCFTCDAMPRQHSFSDRESALHMFSMLRGSGKEVFLCERTGSRFNVCHAANTPALKFHTDRAIASNLHIG